MSTSPIQPLPTSRQLVKATALAVGIAGILLVTVILPAEFDLDPTGVGARNASPQTHVPTQRAHTQAGANTAPKRS